MMTATLALLIVGLGWLVIGVATGVVMGRRGHDPYAWLVVGLLLGPLALPLAVVAASRPDLVRPRRLVAGTSADGRVDLLVGIDGSAQAAAALDAALDVLGARLGRLTLAAVTDVDATVAHAREEVRLRQELERQAGRAQARLAAAGVPAAAELLLLRGRPASALLQQAAVGGYGLLAVGTRGAGLTPRLLGGVAESLAAGTTVPVLLASDGHGTRPPPGRTTAVADTGGRSGSAPAQRPADRQPAIDARPHAVPTRAS